MPSNMLTSAIAMYESTPGKVTLAKFVKDNLAVVLLCSAVVIMLILISILGLLKKRVRLRLLQNRLQMKHNN